MLLTTPHTRSQPYRLWLLSLLLVPAAASALDRDGVLAEAARYAEHAWQMKPENQKASCKADYTSDYTPGPQVGVPYAWGGWMTLTEFDRRLASGQAAGSHTRHGVLSCVAGVDCSGFVSQVWQLPQRQTTSSISAVTQPISLDALEPGDALNKAGSHIVLYAGKSSDGNPIIYEASGSASRVRMATPGWSYLAGYKAVRYKGLPVTAVAAAPQEPPATTSSATPVTRVDEPAPEVPANRTARLTLQYGKDVGFTPGGEDAQAIGPDYLVAGPRGLAALYDPVRRQVLILSRQGVQKTLAVENADGLDFTPQGQLAVLDGASRRILLFQATGEPVRTIELPSAGFLGSALTLERGVLYVTAPSGDRKPVAEISNGTFKPTRGGAPNLAPVLRRLKGGNGAELVEVGGETLSVPPSLQVGARPFGPWVELTATWTDEQGSLRVRRTLRRPKQRLELPATERRAYTPLADLAVVPGGETLLFLEPGATAVSVIWIDA